ncbi:winged helix-turn-helix domain-containing protein (plasmid) [Haladaptatus sp. SPP-AMP-3]|uniref:ArsR/SmtB family transcription factor n=1 Tax=Haladaptatus sp. SPP-AMP-3 TaxID=3121295 RepID=UPI003C2CDFEC
MVDFLPSTVDSVADEDRDPRVVGVDSEDADALVAALSSQTGRDILATLYEEPATPATIAERVETSLQNVQYHLGKLEDSNLVEVADTAYSSKGREMNVYAPTAEPLVLFAGNESDTVGLKSALSNLFGGLGVLGLASLVVQRLATNRPIIGPIFQMGSSGNADSGKKVATTTARSADAGGSAGNAATTTHTPAADGGTTREAARTTAEAATTVANKTTTALHASTTSTTRTVAEGASGAGIPPGALFFAGGALILALGFFVWYRREKRRGQR